jgi:hypothetical protein
LRFVSTDGDGEAACIEIIANDAQRQSYRMHKPAPNKTIVGAAWETVKGAATISGCTDLVAKVGGFIVELMQ